MEYKVTEKDLIGDIEYFPIEVVEKMIEEQVEQGNDPDVSVFQKDRSEIKENGGFSWCETADGKTFWSNVADYKDFNLFFQKYPKQKQLTIQKDMETNKIILNGITLPTDTEVKVSVEEGTTIITFSKQESESKEPKFKDGDILLLTNNDGFEYIAIFKEMDNAIIYVYTSINITNNRIGENDGFFRDKMSNVRKADYYEQERMFKELANQKQLRWNAEEFKFEPIRWRAEKGGKFWFITSNGVVDYAIDNYKSISYLCFNSRNYFQTEELAKKAQPLWKEFFKNLSL